MFSSLNLSVTVVLHRSCYYFSSLKKLLTAVSFENQVHDTILAVNYYASQINSKE